MNDENPGTLEPRRAPILVMAGVLAIAVAAWGLTGGPDLPDLNLLPWVLIGVGTLAGVVLIASGFRRRP
ncbi:hypothetical protein [Gordonia sp. (in: high G+C Gram-positive bacteria)]|uniref:hypothetical protein n=1 Tax=unclassified Gordonia (in: high G+C Gram-positive bacteria) TaxID=2657482 RepID=UPI0026179DC0|nr:hypothetical protein [Gordonia sp. (in: high G+C Gram-positive bacteria)]